jgi:hypothetical protein
LAWRFNKDLTITKQVLARYAGEHRFIIGLPTANRKEEEKPMMPAVPTPEPRLTATPALVLLGCAGFAALLWTSDFQPKTEVVLIDRNAHPLVGLVNQ